MIGSVTAISTTLTTRVDNTPFSVTLRREAPLILSTKVNLGVTGPPGKTGLDSFDTDLLSLYLIAKL